MDKNIKMVSFGFEQNIGQIIILLGAFVGNFAVTMLPYWKEKTRFGQHDLRIIFDHKFLVTALIAGVTSFAIVSAAYDSIISEVETMGNVTVVLAFLAATAIGAGLNKGFNLAIPSPNTEQKADLEQMKSQAIIADYEDQKMIAGLKLNSDEEKNIIGGLEVTPTK